MNFFFGVLEYYQLQINVYEKMTFDAFVFSGCEYNDDCDSGDYCNSESSKCQSCDEVDCSDYDEENPDDREVCCGAQRKSYSFQ